MHPSASRHHSTASATKNAMSYVEKNKYGVHGDDSEEDDPDILAAQVDQTPMTKRRIGKEENLKKVEKLGPYATAFTIFKGFVCTGILYMPKDFINGGWLFSAICVLGALFLTLYCASLLLEVSATLKLNDFPSLGFKCFGKPGKIAVDIVLFSSQFGFVTAYIFFIAQQVGGPLGIIQCATSNNGLDDDCSDGVLINKWWFLLICSAIYIPLVFVRKIEVFAVTHLFGDVMIIITILVIFSYAGYYVHDNGSW